MRNFQQISRMSSTGSVSTKIEKPELRRLHRYIAQNLFMGSIAAGLLSALIFKYTVALPRKRRYEEFCRNYDDEARTKFLLEHGVVNPDEYGLP